MNSLMTAHPHAVHDCEGGLEHAVIRKILVVIDPMACEYTSVEKAARIASSVGSSIDLYVCEVDAVFPGGWADGASADDYRKLIRKRRLDDLEQIAAPLRAQGLQVTLTIEWHSRVEIGVGCHALRTTPDLVVKAATLSSLQTDCVLLQLICPPLLLVRSKSWPDRPRVMAAVDPCHPAERPATLDEEILTCSRSITSALAGQLEIVHVLGTAPHLPGEKGSVRETAEAQVHERATVHQLLKAARVSEVPAHFEEGRVLDTLVNTTEQYGADILAIGSAARARWGQSVASTTAAQILNRIDCDLLIAKPREFVSPLLVTDEP